MTKARDLANGGFGLVLIKPSTVVGGTDNGKGTVSFSAQTSVSLNDVFNATYTNYRVVVEYLATFGETRYRFRVAGADNTTANYNTQYISAYSTTVSAIKTTGQTSGLLGYSNSAGRMLLTMDIANPFATERTTIISHTNNYADTAIETWFVANNFTATTSFTGFTLLPAAGGMTGSVSVYGYNK